MSELTKISRPQINFVPATYKCNSYGSHIEYSSYDPQTASLQRYRIRLRQFKKSMTASAFRAAVNQMILNINAQLMAYSKSMYNMPPVFHAETIVFPPMDEQEDRYCVPASFQVVSPLPKPAYQKPLATPRKPKPAPKPKKNDRKSVKMVDVLTRFEEEKKLELKPTTLHSYSAFCHQLSAWIKKNKPDYTASDFSQVDAVEYMEFVYSGGNSTGKKVGAPKFEESKVTARTYNNNLKLARCFFSWAIEKCYATENPFAKIRVKKEDVKERTLIPIEDRKKIYEYFMQNRPEMCIVMQLVYVSLLRPIEITRVRVRQINFADHCIEMPNTQTKNGKYRVGRMDEALEALLRKHIAGADPDDYLFADKIWRYGKEPMNNHTFGNTWLAMRKELELPASYQLYSLRDCGVNNMLEAGISPLDTMQAAGHSDLSMTTRYANHENKKLVQTLNEKAPSLFGEIKSPEGKTPPSSDETSHAH